MDEIEECQEDIYAELPCLSDPNLLLPAPPTCLSSRNYFFKAAAVFDFGKKDAESDLEPKTSVSQSTCSKVGMLESNARIDLQGAAKVQTRHRIPRSAVRPFLCCASELSLVSLLDNLELPREGQTARGEGQISLTNFEKRPSDQLLSHSYSCDEELSDTACADSNGTPVRRSKGNKQKSKKSIWSLRFRSKWSKGLKLSSSSRQNNCSCTAMKCSVHGLGTNKDCACECELDFCNSPSHQPCTITGKGRTKTKNRRASVGNLACNFDRNFPFSGNEEVLSRKHSHERHWGMAIEPRLLACPTGTAWRNGVLGASAASPTSALRATHDSRCLQPPDSSQELAGGESSSLLSEFAPLVHWPMLHSNIVDPKVNAVVHTQVDFMHHLVPDLAQITKCSFYWGIIDRYEAEKLLDKKREGTFLLRDSAQEDFLFSVSFRRYNRSLHARIEQFNHRFSFDVLDPAVFSSETVCGLIEHYKDSSRCLFFEPLLTDPLHRSFPFSLQHLARAVICKNVVYDSISYLPLPNSLKQYVRYYHYKQRVRVRRFDCSV